MVERKEPIIGYCKLCEKQINYGEEYKITLILEKKVLVHGDCYESFIRNMDKVEETYKED